MPRTNVYVDGFNLYYGSLRGTRYRWLDLEHLCRRLLPDDDIRRINYYTARVGERPENPDQPIRQDTYLRALGTRLLIRIKLGHYLSHPVFMRLADPPADGPKFARIIKTEEKGSDVNLAIALTKVATFLKTIRSGVLRASQFPDTLTDANESFRKPAGW